MKILLIYHFFHPDTVISAQLFSDLAEYLAHEGHDITVFTGNRLIRNNMTLPKTERWNGVSIERFSRPNFSQGNHFGRLFNSGILQLKWLRAFSRRREEFDAVIIGTDPQFSYLMFPFLRVMSRKVKLIHWAFDLYPDAILVNSPKWMKLLAGLTKPFVPLAYRPIDAMVDIGSCMRERLIKYNHKAIRETLTPWALAEPKTMPRPDERVRKKLFGDATLGLLYSGTVGYAHELKPFIELARECRRRGIDAGFCFAGFGNCFQAQIAELTPQDTNIRLAGFASEKELEMRLAAADIHLISLRRGYEGIVVPSKFFGALAIGRPILFSGAESSEIARWCQQYGIGSLLNMDSVDQLAELIGHPELLSALQQRAFVCYHKVFSKEIIERGWHELLHTLKVARES